MAWQNQSVSKGRSPDTGRLQEIVRRIVEVAKPQKIIMFGSAARGEMGPNSDVDLLVVKAGSYHRGQLAEDIYLHLHGVGEPVDVVIVTPEEVERYQDSSVVVVGPAVKGGRVVYAA